MITLKCCVKVCAKSSKPEDEVEHRASSSWSVISQRHCDLNNKTFYFEDDKRNSKVV